MNLVARLSIWRDICDFGEAFLCYLISSFILLGPLLNKLRNLHEYSGKGIASKTLRLYKKGFYFDFLFDSSANKVAVDLLFLELQNYIALVLLLQLICF